MQTIHELCWWDKPRMIGSYEMGPTIGKGAYGKVKVATERDTGRYVALKIIDRCDYRDGVMKGFHNEVSALSKLTGCDHVVHLESYAFVNYPAKYLIFHKIKAAVITMEKARCNLTQCLHNKGFPYPIALNIFSQLMDAISYCHEHGICHRDIKTSNLLVSEDYRVLLADFGLAHSGPDRCHTICGTYRYMAPEIMQTIQSQYNGFKADIWSAGVCYIVLLTGGQFPYMVASSIDPYFTCIDHKDWTKYKQKFGVKIGLPEDCYSLVQRIMISDPRERPNAKLICNIIPTDQMASDKDTISALKERCSYMNQK